MNLKHRQNGTTLAVALIMLVVLTLLVISSIRSSNTDLRIAQNMQVQEEAVAAAQQAVEQVISVNFTANPAASAVTTTIGGAAYNVAVSQPACTNSVAISNSDPNLPSACISSGAAQNTGIKFVSGTTATTTGTSWCYTQQWDVQATASDANTGATATVHQGVGLYVPTGTSCP